MVVAAYVVGGFLVSSVYAAAMLRGRTDHYHRLGFIIGFTVAAIAMPIQMGVGDGLARWVYNNQPVKFAAIELVPATTSDVPETLLGRLSSSGQVEGGLGIPGLASWLSDPSTGSTTVVQGLDSVPADQRPTYREVNVVHLAWDVMVGLGTLLFLFTLWFWASVMFRRRMPRSRWFLGGASVCGVLAVVALEAGWTLSEVGRQPWIVYNVMRVEDAATTNSGVWVTFIGVAVLYVLLGVSLVLVLLAMSRRFRAQEAREAQEGFDDTDSPYGPRQPAPDVTCPFAMSTAAASRPDRRGHLLRGLRGSGLRSGPLGPDRRRDGAWRAPARGHRPLDRPGVGSEPRVAHLHFVVLWTCFPEAYASITLTFFVPLTIAAFGIVLRGAGFAFRKAVVRTRFRRAFGALFAISSVLVPYCFGAVAGGIASRPRAGGWPGRRPLGQLGQPDLDHRRVSWPSAWRHTWLRSSWCGTPAGSPTRAWCPTSVSAPSPRAWWPAPSPWSVCSWCAATPRTSSTGSPRALCPSS